MCVQTWGIGALTPVESLYSERPSMHTWTTGQSERRTIHTHVDKWAIGTTLAAHVSAATNVQDEGQSQLCLEGSACKCSAGSLANNNIGTCQRVSVFMNCFCKLLPAVGGDMQRYWKQLPASVWCQLNQLPPAVGRGMHRGWKMAPADVACKLPPAVGRGMHGG